MELKVERARIIGEALHGKLYVDGVFQCYTLERENVAIPSGRFRCRLYDSPGNGYTVLLLEDVPGRFDIEIHRANWPYQLKGCIAVGEVACNGYIERSEAAFKALMAKVGKADNLWITVSPLP